MNIERLNININGVPAPSFDGGDAIFSEVGLRVGAVLPASYVHFIMKVDGGHPEVGCFYPQEGDPHNLFSVDWFYSFANPDVENIKTALDGWSVVLGKHAMPIGRDAGGNQIYLALDVAVPSVWIYLHDENGSRVKLANSFEEFLASLMLNPDFI